MTPPFSIFKNCEYHENVRFVGWVNAYNSIFEEGCFIGPHCEIGGAVIGERTKVSSHSYICPGVTLGKDCFIGHGVMFTNDLYDQPEQYEKVDELSASWDLKKTKVGNCVRIGSNATILPVEIGDHAIIGSGSVVTKSVPPYAVVAGVPAKVLRVLNPQKN